MKLAIPTKAARRENKRKREAGWHTVFAFFPLRLDANHIVWMEKVLRRRRPGNSFYGEPKWEYKESVFDLIKGE